jgi:hypothetical protein
MISEIKSASDHSMALLMGDKENILKSILRQLFEGIYREIEGKCNGQYPLGESDTCNGHGPLLGG